MLSNGFRINQEEKILAEECLCIGVVFVFLNKKLKNSQRIMNIIESTEKVLNENMSVL
jgi:hypothetical protein